MGIVLKVSNFTNVKVDKNKPNPEFPIIFCCFFFWFSRKEVIFYDELDNVPDKRSYKSERKVDS